MESIILKYLSKTYTLDVQDNTVLDNGDKVYGKTLVSEIVQLFGVSDSTATALVEIWIEDSEPNFDIKKFWLDREYNVSDVILPIAQRIAARTVGHDLVSVQPLSAPTGLLTYIDYNYSGASRNARVYDEEIFTAHMIPPERFGRTGELDHPDNTNWLNIFSGRTGV
jgi:hypothetical protein